MPPRCHPRRGRSGRPPFISLHLPSSPFTQAREIREAFIDFKREILKAAENSRTGKPIPGKLIKSFEEQEQSKDFEVEKLRLANINRRNVLRKLEGTLRQKEKLADGAARGTGRMQPHVGASQPAAPCKLACNPAAQPAPPRAQPAPPRAPSLRAHVVAGLHLIDFEQLKIENQTLNEKIEARSTAAGTLWLTAMRQPHVPWPCVLWPHVPML